MSIPFSEDLIGYWPLGDNGSGGLSLSPIAGSSGALTATGSVSLGTGHAGGAAVFSNTQFQSLSRSDVPVTGDFTISCWVKFSSLDSYSGRPLVFSLGTTDGSLIRVYGDNVRSDGIVTWPWRVISGTLFYGGAASLYEWNIGVWNHFVLVCENGNLSTYLNATPNSGPNSIVFTLTGGVGYDGWTGISIGGNAGEGTPNASVDEFAVYSRALTSSEVLSLFEYDEDDGSYAVTSPVSVAGISDNLILTNPGVLRFDNMGSASLTREYSCFKNHESVADALLQLSTAPINYRHPSNIAGLSAGSVDKSESNGIISYSVKYSGVNTAIDANRRSTSVVSFSIKPSATDSYSGKYLTTTDISYYVSESADYTPSLPSDSPVFRIIEVYANTGGWAAGAEDFFTSNYATYISSSEWVQSSIKATRRGSMFIIERVAIYTPTWITYTP